MSDQLDFLVRNLGNFLFGVPNNRPGGLLMSLLLSVGGLIAGLLLAVAVAGGLSSRLWPVRAAVRLYARTIRGIPLVLLLLIVHRLLISVLDFRASTTSLLAALVALILYSSAYQADIIESGLRAVPSAVMEDALLLGASRRRTYLTATLPYGLRIMGPALLSQAITLFKDSSVVVILGVADLTTTARIVLGSDVSNAPYWVATYLTVGVLYFAVAFVAARAAERLHRSIGRSGLVASIG